MKKNDPIVAHRLDYKDDHYFDLETGENKDEVASRYSRMKFGSVVDTLSLAQDLAIKYIARLRNPQSGLLSFFKDIAQRGEQIIIFAPGYRNVESGSNRIVEVAADLINIELATQGLPTIIVNKLTRLGSNPANYAQLSAEERRAIGTKTRTVAPGEKLFQMGVHVIFGDDVKITGSTVERLKAECLAAGAKSFSEMYAIQINPKLAETMPEIEDMFNLFQIKGGLDQEITDILNQKDFKPVQRLIRLILSKENREQLADFLSDPNKTPNHAVIRLYISALKNDYKKDEKYKESVDILIAAAKARNIVDSKGQPVYLSLL